MKIFRKHQAMSFFNDDGLPASWKQAAQFAGSEGHIATMPDIVTARMNANMDDHVWNCWYTTSTAEYLGFSKAGNRILIVAHGVGPMATLDGTMEAYRWHYSDKNRDRRGGRITTQQFLDLESGKYGEVSIIDFESYYRRYKYPFLQVLCFSELITDPLVKARLGPNAEAYLNVHLEGARRWHRIQAGLSPDNKYQLPAADHERFLARRHSQHERDGAEYSDPYLLKLEGAANCTYTYWQRGHRPIEEGYAIAHLISTGRLCHLCHEGAESLTDDLGCHEWSNGVRFVGITAGGSTKDGINEGPDAHRLIRQYWKKLFQPVAKPEPVGFAKLIEVGDRLFTEYPKVGERMDTGEPEYLVTKKKKLGGPVQFSTTGNGSMFFKYGLKEVQRLAPTGANAYDIVSDPMPAGEMHVCMVQFYRVEADTTKRLLRQDKLAHDYDKMMSLMGV